MYSTVCWIPKGCSSRKPTRAIPTAAEIAEYKKVIAEQNQTDALRESEEFRDEEIEQSGVVQGIMGDNIPLDSLDPTKDPNIALPEEEWDSESDDDLDIRPTDCVLMAAKSEEEQSSLEFHVYDEESGNFYLHHDILLAAYPLSLEWLDCYPHEVNSANGHPCGSYVAVGTFRPEIEIWNTDVIDVMEPECVLGGLVGGKKRALKAGSHRQAVMGLSWNREYRNILASSSADTTVKLWDITTQRCMLTLNYHKDKVPCVAFHPREANVLLTAGFDRLLAITDGRSPTNGTWFGIPAVPESACWDTFDAYGAWVATESGECVRYDVRQPQQPLWSQKTHAGSCTAVAPNAAVPQLVATSGEDGFVRVWRCGEKMELVAERKMQMENVFCCRFFASEPYLLAACGASQELCLWDLREIDALREMLETPVEKTEEKVVFEASGDAQGTLNDVKKKKKN